MKRNSGNNAVARMIGQGSLRFAAVSVGGFAVWAVFGSWCYRHIGEPGLYALCAIVFLGLSGLFLAPLLEGPGRIRRFYNAFIPAFLGYAMVWSGAWFLWHFGKGEWIGNALGSLVFTVLLGWGLGGAHGWCKVTLVMFIGQTLGYFLGSYVYMHWAHPPLALGSIDKKTVSLIAKLLWGFCYGAGFGAGIGYAFAVFGRVSSWRTSNLAD